MSDASVFASFNPFEVHPFTSMGSQSNPPSSDALGYSSSRFPKYPTSNAQPSSMTTQPSVSSSDQHIHAPQPRRGPPSYLSMTGMPPHNPTSQSGQPVFTAFKVERLTPGLDDLPVLRKKGSSWGVNETRRNENDSGK